MGTLQVFLFLLQYTGIWQTWMIGSFNNAAGFSSFVSLAYPCLFIHFKGNRANVSFVFLFLLFVIGIILSESRTGILCMVLVGILNTKIKKKYLLPIVCLMICLFLLKFDSTSGRWFVYNRTWDMILEKPIMGWGTGGFKAHYMDIQADYFAQHENSNYALLAGSIHHPLNEFMLLAVNYGLGLSALSILSFFLTLLYYKHNRDSKTSLGIQWLICIIVFALFSYPLFYPHVWFFLFMALGFIFHHLIEGVKIPLLVVIFIPVVCILFTIKKYQVYCDWEQAHGDVQNGDVTKAAAEYGRLYSRLHDDSRYLYCYAFALYETARYKEALILAKECKIKNADYDVSLLLGDIYFALDDKKNAVSCYRHAHNMCPSRFAPLCAIYSVYKHFGEYNKCRQLRSEILTKPIKVHSTETLDLIKDVEKDSLLIDSVKWQ